jgi:hypothetical protein
MTCLCPDFRKSAVPSAKQNKIAPAVLRSAVHRIPNCFLCSLLTLPAASVYKQHEVCKLLPRHESVVGRELHFVSEIDIYLILESLLFRVQDL